MDTILEIKSVSKTFVKEKRKKDLEEFKLINNLTLSVERGKITALIGGNGTGKTTLFNLISGFLSVDEGEIIFRDGDKEINLQKLPSHKIEQLGIGRLFQDNHIFPDLTVLENMMIAHEDDFGELPLHVLFRYKKSMQIEEQRKEKAKMTIEMLFGEDSVFWEKRYFFAKNMSYGQQRLLGLARLFMANYKLVLLDEPTAGVNPQTNETIAKIIKRMVRKSGMTVFLIEHNMHFVKQVADICAFLNNGKIEIIGTPEQVIANPKVRKSYLGT